MSRYVNIDTIITVKRVACGGRCIRKTEMPLVDLLKQISDDNLSGLDIIEVKERQTCNTCKFKDISIYTEPCASCYMPEEGLLSQYTPKEEQQ